MPSPNGGRIAFLVDVHALVIAHPPPSHRHPSRAGRWEHAQSAAGICCILALLNAAAALRHHRGYVGVPDESARGHVLHPCIHGFWVSSPVSMALCCHRVDHAALYALGRSWYWLWRITSTVAIDRRGDAATGAQSPFWLRWCY